MESHGRQRSGVHRRRERPPGVKHSEIRALSTSRKLAPNVDANLRENTARAKELPNRYRTHATEASSQPSFGERVQLIADGLCDPAEHLRRAKSLDHPIDSLDSLKPEHAIAIAGFSDSQGLISRRLDALHVVKTWANTLLMECLQHLLGIQDQQVLELCLKGLRITSRAHESSFFEQLQVGPSVTRERFSCRLSRTLRTDD